MNSGTQDSLKSGNTNPCSNTRLFGELFLAGIYSELRTLRIESGSSLAANP
jgi:hypothetical protein